MADLTNQEMVAEFHQKYHIDQFNSYSIERIRLIVEEAAEAVIAIHEYDKVKMADAFADLLYVTYGSAQIFNIPLDQVFKIVHESNMTKSKLDKHGKGGKDDGYQPPEPRIAALLGEKGQD